MDENCFNIYLIFFHIDVNMQSSTIFPIEQNYRSGEKIVQEVENLFKKESTNPSIGLDFSVLRITSEDKKIEDSTALKLGLMVFVIAILHIYSFVSGDSKRNPARHTTLMILGYTVLIPYLLKTSPSWYGYPMQIFVTVMILILDWFSFHEDMSRFSEEELCMFGNCRWNARITGHLAHIMDTLAIGIMTVPYIDDPKIRSVVIGAFVIYIAAGCKVIENMTIDGSGSDLRGKSEKDKCLQARIMRNSWRGALNDVITVLGIMLAWQSFFTCDQERCNADNFPLNQIKVLFEQLDPSAPKKMYYLMLVRVLIMNVGMVIIPTYMNYVNTSYQHGKMKAEEFGLPDCYDDPEDY
jgi:hypothetical protein